MATVPHVTSGAGRTKFQASWFLLKRLYQQISTLNKETVVPPQPWKPFMKLRGITFQKPIISEWGEIFVYGIFTINDKKYFDIPASLLRGLQYTVNSLLIDVCYNPLAPNDVYILRTAQLTSRRCILNIYSTNIFTEYFKHAAHSPFFFKMPFIS